MPVRPKDIAARPGAERAPRGPGCYGNALVVVRKLHEQPDILRPRSLEALVKLVPPVALVALILASTPALAATHTYEVRVEVYCPSVDADYPMLCDRYPLGEPEMTQRLEEAIDELNLEYRPTGVSFRLAHGDPVRYHYDTKVQAITAESGDSNNADISNDDLVTELRRDIAKPNAHLITLFILYDHPTADKSPLDHCWANPPPKPDAFIAYGIFCTPSAS